MFRQFRRWQSQKIVHKVQRGDGHLLEPYHLKHLFSRSLFYAKLREDDDIVHIYAVNVNYFSEESTTELYRDGKHWATSELPAIFPVPGGMIEVATSTYGLKRMHYVTHEGTEHPLAPDPLSTEGLRMRFDARFPGVSAIVGKIAIVVLLVSLLLGLPQLAATISQISFIADLVGTFESPVALPNWLNRTLLVSGALAAVERALMLRSHWLIDMETSWWDT